MPTTAPTYAEFVAFYPAFATLAQPVVDSYIARSARILAPSAWGDFYSDAVGLDAAHSLAMSQTAIQGPTAAFQGATGPISSVSAAGISTSFAAPTWNEKSKSENWYMKTVYGQEFLRLRDTVIAPGGLSA